MKAIIPVAGYATRLYPLTENMPKSLLDIQGKPMIEHIIDKLLELGAVDEIYIVSNAKFHPNFEEWLKNFKCTIPIKLLNDNTTSNENRLGQIGDIALAMKAGNINDDLISINGDNLFNFSLKNIYEFFKEKRVIVNALHDAKSLRVAQEQGNASIDASGRVILFEEKPKEPKTTYVSPGIYFFPREKLKLISEYLNSGGNPDKMGYFMIWLTERKELYGFVYEEKYFDIGWPEALEQARREFHG